MSDEATLREQYQRGETLERASKLLNELVFDELRQRCINTFEISDLNDDVGHRTCRAYLRVLNDIRDRVQVLVQSGKNAEAELVRLKDPSKLRRLINARR